MEEHEAIGQLRAAIVAYNTSSIGSTFTLQSRFEGDKILYRLRYILYRKGDQALLRDIKFTSKDIEEVQDPSVYFHHFAGTSIVCANTELFRKAYNKANPK